VSMRTGQRWLSLGTADAVEEEPVFGRVSSRNDMVVVLKHGCTKHKERTHDN
jgi:hypothetical protein